MVMASPSAGLLPLAVCFVSKEIKPSGDGVLVELRVPTFLLKAVNAPGDSRELLRAKRKNSSLDLLNTTHAPIVERFVSV
jgi:hypothetical protein